MPLARNIRFLRKMKDMGQDELAAKLGYKSFTTVQKWETGVAEPPFKTVQKLAEIFNVSLHDLSTKDLSGAQVRAAAGSVRIPVVGKVAAGIPIEAVEDILDWEEIPAAMATSGEFFALKIQGESMQPKMEEGDVVIVRKQASVENGETAVVMVNGEDATVKKIKITDGGIMLVATNPKFEPMFYSNDEIHKLPVTIVGKVVELRAKF